ncbi:hypothetical protein F5Y18DRAFT_437344 [Xylariaceae sp. FL1019]|nr:hypothetical protein F5Y18DRAFT_437344 [Xylariaceae sp. FL1019]
MRSQSEGEDQGAVARLAKMCAYDFLSHAIRSWLNLSPEKADSIPNPTTKNFLLRVIGSYELYPIHRALLPMLDTRDLLALPATSTKFRKGIHDTVWNINTKLARFFDDPVAFRTQLGMSNGLISGSFALQFLEGVTWKDSDLDILIQHGEDADAIEQCLIEQGYEFVEACTHPERYLYAFVAECKKYVKKKQSDNNLMNEESNTEQNATIAEATTANCGVEIITTHDIPVWIILKGFYTTCVMNFITWNRVYSIFPRVTFLEHETIPLKPLDTHYGQCLLKYSVRGWPMATHPMTPKRWNDLIYPQALSDHMSCNRRVGDGDTWILKLDTKHIPRPPKPDFVVECCSFTITSPVPQRTGYLDLYGHLMIEAYLLESPVLRYRYTHGYNLDLSHIFARATRMQLCKVKKKDLHLVYDEASGNVRRSGRYDVPGWDYQDEKYPGYLRDYFNNPNMLYDMGYVDGVV